MKKIRLSFEIVFFLKPLFVEYDLKMETSPFYFILKCKLLLRLSIQLSNSRKKMIKPSHSRGL